MKQIINDQKWHLCDTSFVSELSGCTSSPGELFELDPSCLPENMRKMSGLETVYVSGYVNPKVIETGVLSGCGEFVVTREDHDLRKAYNYAVGINESGDYLYAGPFKHFDTHHTPLSGAIPIDHIFGHIK